MRSRSDPLCGFMYTPWGSSVQGGDDTTRQGCCSPKRALIPAWGIKRPWVTNGPPEVSADSMGNLLLALGLVQSPGAEPCCPMRMQEEEFVFKTVGRASSYVNKP